MRKLLALLVICSAVLACDTRYGTSVTAPFSAEIGNYSLMSVSGASMPVPLATITAGQSRLLVSDSLFLTSGGNVHERYYIRTITAPATITGKPDTSLNSFALAGKYTITRDSIGVPAEFGYRFGRYASGTVTLTDNQGFVFVFKKP